MTETRSVLGVGLLYCQAALRRLGCNADVRQQYWDKNQVGENQHPHADTGGQGQFANHRNIDDHQDGKADHVRQQRGHSRQEQAAKGVAGGDQTMGASANVLHDAVHFLRTMADADGKHQEWHQHGEWIEVVTEQRNQTQLPDHRHDRTAQHQQRTADAAGVGVDDGCGDKHCGEEEQRDLFQPGDQVADHLGEANHIDLDLGILTLAIALTNLLDRL
ncbi:hypothetical protein D3C85_939600 [compost metagenome]